MLKVIKLEQSIYECLLAFVLTIFSAPPQILAASTVSSPTQKRNDGDGFGATAGRAEQ